MKWRWGLYRIVKALRALQTRWNSERGRWTISKLLLYLFNNIKTSGDMHAVGEAPLGGWARFVLGWSHKTGIWPEGDCSQVCSLSSVHLPCWGRKFDSALRTSLIFSLLKDINIWGCRKPKVAWGFPRYYTTLYFAVLICLFFFPSDFDFLLISFPSSFYPQTPSVRFSPVNYCSIAKRLISSMESSVFLN